MASEATYASSQYGGKVYNQADRNGAPHQARTTYTNTRQRFHVHDYHGLPVPPNHPGATPTLCPPELHDGCDGSVANREWSYAPTAAGPHQGFRNSPSSPYWPLPPQPFCNELYEDLSHLKRPAVAVTPTPLEGEPLVPPEALGITHDRVYLAEAEHTLRRQTAERLMEHLPDLTQDWQAFHGFPRRPEAPEGYQPPGYHPVPFKAPAGVSEVGFAAGRTPVDSSARLLASYMTSSEPSFGTTTPAYQAARIGTLSSEAPLLRDFGPVWPVQGVMYSRYTGVANHNQCTKNYSLGRNRTGPLFPCGDYATLLNKPKAGT